MILRRVAYIIVTLMALTGFMAFATDISRGAGIVDQGAFFKANGSLSSRALIDKAWESVKKERFDSAAAYYALVASRYSESAPIEEIEKSATASVNVGYIWLSWRMNSEEAYAWLKRAADMAVKHGLKDVEIGVNSNLGQLYYNYGNIPKSLMYLQKAFECVVNEKADLYYTMCIMELSVVAVLNDCRSALEDAVEKSKKYEVTDAVPQGAYSLMLCEALDNYLTGNPGKGAAVLEKAFPLLSMDTDKKRYAVMHYLITGKMWQAAGRFADGVSNIKKGIEIASGEGYYNLVEKGCQELAECYRLAGAADSAAYCQARVVHIRDSLFNVANFEAVKDSAIAGELDALNSSVENAELKARYHRNVSVILLVAGVILAGVAVWLWVSRKKLNGAYRELYRKNMDLLESGDMKARALPDGDGNTEVPCNAEEDREARELVRKIESVMSGSQEIYDAGFSVESLSEMIGVHPRTVSRVINQVTGKSFSSMLCEYRIREACRQLSDVEKLRTMKIESVAENVGYRSRSHFSKVFKEVTGLTPTQFLNQVRASEQERRLDVNER